MVMFLGRRFAVAVIALAVVASLLPSCGDDAERCEPLGSETESVARLWTESALEAIRRDFPAPTVHARNLWHLSAVMWDAWAAYTPDTEQYFVDMALQVPPDDRERAITEAASYAAYELLFDRYRNAFSGSRSLAGFNRLLDGLCYVLPRDNEFEPGSPAAVGLEIAEAAIAFGRTDGARELGGYIDEDYQPINEPLVVASDEIVMVDPNRWQPLKLAERITQNGQAQDSGLQVFIGSHWGEVESFALPRPDERGVTLDTGAPPLLAGAGAAEFVAGALEVIAYADTLGGLTGTELVDISPAAMGNNSVGQNDGSGHEVNPSTGRSYDPNRVPLADYGRVIAEYWADGPDSETPPGHWNALAIEVSDAIDADDLRWAGAGPALSRFEWDVRLFFALNASLHDAAIATWGTKRAYDYVRPISMIRYLAAVDELPITSGLVEIVTAQTAAAEGRHEGLPIGATVVRSWLGPPENTLTQTAGVGWLEASDWLPYQRPTFVSPAFAGYVSGHSAFSRAAADVLTRATNDAFFPGGMFTHVVEAGDLLHEDGPSVDVELQWATYADAADEAGESRRYGGIHVAADDFAGRLLGEQVAERAWDASQQYFPGS